MADETKKMIAEMATAASGNKEMQALLTGIKLGMQYGSQTRPAEAEEKEES